MIVTLLDARRLNIEMHFERLAFRSLLGLSYYAGVLSIGSYFIVFESHLGVGLVYLKLEKILVVATLDVVWNDYFIIDVMFVEGCLYFLFMDACHHILELRGI
jgi:hypothetical protein